MNKSLSDDTDPILQLQGVGWLIRKAIGMITVTLVTKSYTDDDGTYHVDIEQPGAAGIKGTTELRTVNGTWSEHEDHIFGAVKGTTNWKKLSEYKDDDEGNWLAKGWNAETVESGEVIDSYAESIKNGWVAIQAWGFEDISGERRYVRHVVVKKGDKVIKAKLVYDFQK